MNGWVVSWFEWISSSLLIFCCCSKWWRRSLFDFRDKRSLLVCNSESEWTILSWDDGRAVYTVCSMRYAVRGSQVKKHFLFLPSPSWKISQKSINFVLRRVVWWFLFARITYLTPQYTIGACVSVCRFVQLRAYIFIDAVMPTYKSTLSLFAKNKIWKKRWEYHWRPTFFIQCGDGGRSSKITFMSLCHPTPLHQKRIHGCGKPIFAHRSTAIYSVRKIKQKEDEEKIEKENACLFSSLYISLKKSINTEST